MVFVGLLYFSPRGDGSNMTHDAYCTYARIIESGNVTNWHSSLFMYEGVLLRRFFALFGVVFSGVAIIKIMAIMCTAIAVVAVSYIAHAVSRNIFVYALGVFLTYYIYWDNGCCRAWGLDQFFVLLILPLIACILALHKVSGKQKKMWLVVVCVILLWHCCDFRKNALLTVPLVLYAMLSAFYKFRVITIWKKMAIVGGCGAIFAFILMPMIDTFFPVQKKHPIEPMMLSDLYIAHILEGEGDVFFEKYIKKNKYDEAKNTITAYWYTLESGRSYSELKELYVQSWKERPLLMFNAKSMQICQFYCGGKIPILVRNITERIYPDVRSNPSAWRNGFFIGVKNLVLRWVTFVLILVTSIVAVKNLKLNKDVMFNKAYVYIILFALIYAASYIVVTPTPDNRYLMPSVFVWQVSLLYLLLHWIENHARYMTKKV